MGLFKRDRNYFITCKNCGLIKKVGIQYYSKKYEFCSRSCAAQYRVDHETKRFTRGNDVEKAIIKQIKSAGHYLNLREICKAVKITNRTLSKYGISVLSINKKAGFDYKDIIEYGKTVESLVFSSLVEMFGKQEIKREYFFGCRSKAGRKLRADFVIGDIVIEADGMQHFRQNNSWQTPALIENDEIKNAYCINNGFLMVRVRESAGWTVGRLKNTLFPILTVANHNVAGNGKREGLKIVTLGQSAAKHTGEPGESSTTNSYDPNGNTEGYEETRALASLV